MPMPTLRLPDLEKLTPTSLDAFIGNAAVKRRLSDLLAQPPLQVVLVGGSGVGKTTLTNIILSNNQYDVLRVQGDESSDIKVIKKLVDNFLNNKTIESFFSNKAKLVVMEDIDIYMNTDKTMMPFIFDFVCRETTNKVHGFIITCSSAEEKKLNDLKKYAEVLKITNPPIKESFLRVCEILDNDGEEYEPPCLLKLVEAFRGNLRDILQNLHMLASEGAIQRQKKENQYADHTVYDTCNKLLRHRVPVSDLRNVPDGNLVPLLLFENYPKELFSNRVKTKENSGRNNLENTLTITRNFVDTDALERHMYATTDWSTYDNVLTLKCGYINKIINEQERKPSAPPVSCNFTQVLTKSALRCNYGKKMAILKFKLGICENDLMHMIFDSWMLRARTDGHARDIIVQFKELGFTKDDVGLISQYFAQVGGIEKTVIQQLSKYK